MSAQIDEYRTRAAAPAHVAQVRFTPWQRFVRRLKRVAKRLFGHIPPFFARAAGNSGVLSSLYYVICCRAFRREQRAVLSGMRRYEQDVQDPGEGFALLRRNTHRLEKGLLMRPRRDVFATDYIGETVYAFERAALKRCGAVIEPGSELNWARDVLVEFFAVAGTHPAIDAARERFRQTAAGENGCAARLIPYQRDLEQSPPVGIDDLYLLAVRRRSVRWFLDKPVARELIDRAMEVAAQSPSACNRQPFVFRVLDDPQLVHAAAVIPMGTAGYAHNIPVFLVIVGQQRNYFDERDRHLIYIDSALAAMGFLYALEAQGLSSCCINWPDVEEREQRMSALLNLDADERPVMCIAVGYPDPDALVARSQKKTVPQVRRYNCE